MNVNWFSHIYVIIMTVIIGSYNLEFLSQSRQAEIMIKTIMKGQNYEILFMS